MNIEVLVAAMNQKDYSLIKRMNLKTDAIIGNQSDENNFKTILKNNHKYKYITVKEKGVGQNRNTILFRANGELLTFADEDMIFVDDYYNIILKAFDDLPQADAIIFNIETKGKQVGRKYNNKIKRVHFWNYMNYGAARITVKNKSIKKANICFSRNFGGGTIYSAGEDTLFIHDMLKNKLKIYVYPAIIGSVDQSNSTWFNGYTKKYFYDKGALFNALVGEKKAYILALIMLFKHWKTYKEFISLKESVSITFNGIKGYNNLAEYYEE